MISCFGVDPGGSRWRIADLSFASPQSSPAIEPVRAADFTGAGLAALGDLDFFHWLQRQVGQLDLARETPDGTAFTRQLELLDSRVRRLELGEIYSEQKTTFSERPPKAVGVCHPCSALPIARQMLPVLFDGRRIGSQRRSDFIAPPREANLGDGEQLCAIETPLAGCLDLAARGELSLPSELLVLTGNFNSAELTAVRAALDGDQLVLAIRTSLEMPPGQFPSEESQLRALFGAANVASVRRLVAYGDHLESAARGGARILGIQDSELVFQPEDHIAVGAARYAAMCLSKTLHGAPVPIRGLRVTTGISLDLGVICEGEKGALFWHRLLARGEPVPETPISLPLAGDTPATVVLAARGKCWGPPLSWLERSKWDEHGLVWFAAADIETPPDQTITRLEIHVASPSDRLTRRWSDVTAEIVAVT